MITLKLYPGDKVGRQNLHGTQGLQHRHLPASPFTQTLENTTNLLDLHSTAHLTLLFCGLCNRAAKAPTCLAPRRSSSVGSRGQLGRAEAGIAHRVCMAEAGCGGAADTSHPQGHQRPVFLVLQPGNMFM